MDKENQSKLGKFINDSEKIISKDGIDAVRHYFEHGEYEMSFEGLVIELMNAEIYPDNFIFSEWKELALKFGLDTESVFDGDFWRKFMVWGKV